MSGIYRELEMVNESTDPAKVVEVEIGLPLPEITPDGLQGNPVYKSAVILVRLHTVPLGLLELEIPASSISPARLAQEIWARFTGQIIQHFQADHLPEPISLPVEGYSLDTQLPCFAKRQSAMKDAPLVSVVIATRDRIHSLVSTMASLLKLDYPQFEIILVDDAPKTDETRDFYITNRARFLRRNIDIRYLREAIPGLGLAHNRGLEIARGSIVAFTDDDVIVDRYWLAELVMGFQSAPSVGCVTGLALPAELDTPAQKLFEEFGGFTKGFSPQIYDLESHRPASPLFPYAAGHFGTGANMAFDTEFLRITGGFDPALGIGTPALGADDMAAFYQALIKGKQLVYQPSAVVFHQHRRTYEGLRKQMFGYGVGLTAFLTKCILDRPHLIFDLGARIPAGIKYTLNPESQKNFKKSPGYPKELEWIERKGMLYGPVAYLVSRRRYRKVKQNIIREKSKRQVSTSSN